MDSDDIKERMPCEEESLRLQSCCANCEEILSVDTCVAFYSTPNSRISVYEGLELIFKSREGPVDEVTPTALLKLCASCGHVFGKTLKWYHKFTSATAAQSYVKQLIYSNHSMDASSLVKVEANDGETGDLGSESLDDAGQNVIWGKSEGIEPGQAEGIPTEAASSGDTQLTHDRVVAPNQSEPSSRHDLGQTRKSTRNLGKKQATERGCLVLEKLERIRKCRRGGISPTGKEVGLQESVVPSSESEFEGEVPLEMQGKRRCTRSSQGGSKSTRFEDEYCEGQKKVRKCDLKNKDRRSYVPTSEEESLLNTSDFKCDSKDCTDVSFPTFKQWVVHQHSAHSLDTGYDLHSDPLLPVPGKPRPCPRCGRKAPSHPKMLLHIRTVHLRLKQFSCDACPRYFASRLGLKWHSKSAHSGHPNKFKCLTCSASFPTKGYLEEHEVNTHAALRPFFCDEEGCHKNFRTNDALRSHVKRTHPHRHVQKVTKRRKARDMTEEEKTLLITTEYKCDATSCPAVSLPTFRDWVVHQEETHSLHTGYNFHSSDSLLPSPGKVRPCPLCGKKFKSRFVLLTHVQSVHLRTGRVPCETCGRDFVNELSLKQHRAVTHDGTAQKFLCSLCGASFNSKSYLQEHEGIHNGRLRRSKDCDICGAKFRRRYNLDLHKAEAHAQGDPSVCDICGKVFKVKQRMEIHKRRQHVKKTIIDQICELCGKGYAFKHYLKDHLISVHKLSDEEARSLAKVKLPPAIRKYTVAVKPKTCEYCLRKYVRREQLFTHLMSVHGKTKEEATRITGLETKRQLTPGSTRGKRAKRPSPPQPPFQNPDPECHMSRVTHFERRPTTTQVPYEQHLPFYLG